MTALVFLDRQHSKAPGDLGASTEGHNSSKPYHTTEVALTPTYIQAASAKLAKMGDMSVFLGSGDYGLRAHIAREVVGYISGVEPVYLACHLNAGLKDPSDAYGVVFYDAARPATAGLAEWIASELNRVTGNRTKVIGAKPGDWTKNAYSTIRHISQFMPAFCLEPCFVEQDHLMTPEKLHAMGEAIALGVHRGLRA